MAINIDIQLLGIPTFKVNGRRRKLYSTKVWGLLAYLIMEGDRGHSRHKLATLLWGESSDQQARQSLRQGLYALRKSLGELADTCLFIDGDTISLQGHERLRVDVLEFLRVKDDAVQDIDGLRRIVELHQGQFLEGLDMGDSPAFDEWLFFQRETIEQHALRLYQDLVDQLIVRRMYRYALPIAQKLITLNPLNEGAYQRLMRIHAALGDRDGVRYQYQRCTELLQVELQIEPSAETQSLYHQLTSQDRKSSNLPAPPTPFIGRQKEISELSILLDNPDIRLLTIIGTGGIGKTRLSLAVAEYLLDRFRDGVYFVPLAAIDTADSIVSAIADTIHFDFFGGNPPTDQLHNFLRQKELLLILDNFEHLINDATVVSDILAVAPQIKILATSRERLNLRSETVFVLSGLDFPDSLLETVLEQYGAVKLFLQTAKRVNRRFQADTHDLETIIKICQIVEGMPLGIELAAAWVEVLSLEDIIVEIQHGLDFFKTTLRDMPERHHSIRAVFDSTWKRLSVDEQNVLAKLSVFYGSFTRHAAQVVTGTSLHILMGLVGKSLLARVDGDRFQIHELLRQYNAEKLPELGNDALEKTGKLHSAYYCTMLKQHYPDLNGHRQLEALTEIENDFPNIRIAWMWAVRHHDFELIASALDTLTLYCHMRSRFHESAELLQIALGIKEDVSNDLQATLIIKLGKSQGSTGHYLVGIENIERGLTIARQIGNVDLQAEALIGIGRILGRKGELQKAEPYALKAKDIAQQTQNRLQLAAALLLLGNVANGKGDYELEERNYQQSLKIYQALGDLFSLAYCLNLLGINANDRGNYVDAEHYYLDSLAIQRQLHNQRGIAACLINLGVVAYAVNDFAAARRYYAESLAIRRDIGERWGIAACLGNLGNVVTDLDEARRYHEESLTLFRDIGGQRGIANALTNLGDTLQRQGNYNEAAQYYAQALTTYREIKFAFGEAVCMVGIGNLAREQRDFRQAWQAYCEAISIMKQPIPVALSALAGLAGVAAELERHTESAQWLGLVLHHPATDLDVEKIAEPILSQLKRDLPVDYLNTAIEQGKLLEFEAVVNSIMQEQYIVD